MKKLIISIFTLFVGVLSIAQAPQKISYQALVRDAENKLVSEQAVGMKISILQGELNVNSNGQVLNTAVYIETHQPTTNSNGVVYVEIGGGTSELGNLSTIEWGDGPYFIYVEFDISGGTNYTINGVSQLLSVPYALHANTVSKIIVKDEYGNPYEVVVENGALVAKPLVNVDLDGDGFSLSGGDCDDNDALINPDALDNTKDGIDNDCDGAVDEDYVAPVVINAGDIKVTEIMNNPNSVSDNLGEWFEIYNTTDADLNLNGIEFTDNGSDNFLINQNLTIKAKSFFVLCNNSDVNTNGGVSCDYQYSGFNLTNSDDEIIVKLQSDGTEITKVEYDGGLVYPDPSGASMVFTGTESELNNNAAAWFESNKREGNFNNAVDNTDFGSPGIAGELQTNFGGETSETDLD